MPLLCKQGSATMGTTDRLQGSEASTYQNIGAERQAHAHEHEEGDDREEEVPHGGHLAHEDGRRAHGLQHLRHHHNLTGQSMSTA